MNIKRLLAVLIYLGAILVPTAALLLRFGLDTDVDLTSSHAATEQLLSVGGAVAAGFLIAIVAGRLLTSDTDNALAVVSEVLKDMQSSSRGSMKTR